METQRIKTRFAPSPTGHLHIGGARTALYNWLYARSVDGKFVLRIEDTDIDRNVAGAEEKIRADLDWLGLKPDESPWEGGPDAPYRQSERLEQYQQIARQLIESGHAYYAFDTAEELTAMREAAKREKRQFKYRRTGSPPTDADVAKARDEGRTVVIRMAAPTTAITVHDQILGDVTIEPAEMEDFVILKGNGWPTYHFAVVVDDEAMHITHVIRAQEHLMNTPKHIALQDALGYRRPTYAHVPIVMNMDGTKMSKRDKHKAVRTRAAEWIKAGKWSVTDVAQAAGITADAATRWLDRADIEMDYEQLARVADVLGVRPPEVEVHDFRKAGYLPETLMNFIALVGWSPGEDREKMTREEMVGLFTLERIGKTSARFDREKLLAFNTDACATATPKRLREAFCDYARIADSPMRHLCGTGDSPVDATTLDRALAACKGFRTFADVDAKVGILFAHDDAVKYDPDAVKKVLAKNDGAGYAILKKLEPELASLEPWTVESIDTFMKQFGEANGLKLGDIAQPLRVALTGRTISPTIAETLSLLGRVKSLSRLARCLSATK